jgi:transcriptional regulator with XRE-family HTH domain
MIPDETNPTLDPRERKAIAEAVREMLRVKGFTLYRVAALSRARYPQQAAYHIRRNFYSQLRSGLSPTFQQVLALAELTGSRLWDWLALFGFSLGAIPRLQAVLARPRTGRIDKDLVDPHALVPFFHYRRPGAPLPTVAPLSQLLERSGSYPARSLPPVRTDFVYAKIGAEDALAFPELRHGSIVRADPRLVGSFLPRAPGQRSHHFFLVEHASELNCGRLRVSTPNRIAFVTVNSPLANVEFRLGTEARILGVVDLELRFCPVAGKRRGTANAKPRRSSDLAEISKPTRIATRTSRRSGAWLETARRLAGLSFRCASKLSRVVAKTLGDDRYFASSGTLSDYEAGDRMPRHIHKLFTLAIVYSLAFRDLLRSFGIALHDFGSVAETEVPRMRTPRTRDNGFFENLQNQFGHVPLFLESALPDLSGLAQASLRDVFWLGGERNPLHPSLRGALFVLVNRRSKTPRVISRTSAWTQPLYLLQQRDGSYLAVSCAIENGRLVVYAYSQGSPEGQPVRRHIDADMVGQIVGIARSLLSPS